MKCYTLGIVLFADFSKVMLIKKNKPDWQKGKYNFPGGRVEQNEDSLGCIVREMYEEAGIGVPGEDWKCIAEIMNYGIKPETLVLPSLGEGAYQVNVYATLYNYAKHGEAWSATDEQIEWFKTDNLPKNCISNLYWLLPFAINCFKQGNNDNLEFGHFTYKYPENVASNQH